MGKEKDKVETTVISIRADKRLRDAVAEEAALRNHSVSEAAGQMLKLGMPLYLKRVPKKFERVESA